MNAGGAGQAHVTVTTSMPVTRTRPPAHDPEPHTEAAQNGGHLAARCSARCSRSTVEAAAGSTPVQATGADMQDPGAEVAIVERIDLPCHFRTGVLRPAREPASTSPT